MSVAMRLAISQYGIPLDAPHARLSEFIRACDEEGIDTITAGDVVTQNHELVVKLTRLVLETSRANVMSLVAVPVARHPATLAAAAASLADLSGGRFRLGVGIGFSMASNLGARPSTLAQLREYVATMRALWRDGEAEYRGRPCRVPWAPEVVPEGVPVFLAANGPRSLELAGEIGDAVYTGVGISPDAVAYVRDRVAAGAVRAGRDPDAVEIWYQALVNVDDDSERAVAEIAHGLPVMLPMLEPAIMASPDVAAADKAAVRAFRAGYDYAEHGTTGGDRNVSRARELGIFEMLIDRVAVAGTPAEVAGRLAELQARGVVNLHTTGTVPDPVALVRALGAIQRGAGV